MKISLIIMCVLLMSMTILAVGSCMECGKVNEIEGGNATLPYATSGLTHFYEIDCKNESKIRLIARYCGPKDQCTNMTRNVSIEPDRVILHGVTSNTCYRAEPQQGEKKCYTVTAEKPLHSNISPEIFNSKSSTATPLYNSTSDTSSASKHIAGGVVVVVVVVGGGGVAVGCYTYKRNRRLKRRYIEVFAEV